MNLNKRIIRTMIIVLGLFLILVVYLNYFLAFQSDEYVQSSHNGRKREVISGTIFDRNGEVLAITEKVNATKNRIYPHGSLYAPLIGKTYGGNEGLELKYDRYLTERPSWNLFSSEEVEETELRGQDMYLTLDHGLMTYIKKHPLVKAQEKKDHNVNIVINNPQTGEVYALYSTRSYDPNKEVLKNNENVDRTSDALYTQYYCGSVFKIITAAAAIDNGFGDFEVDDKTGSVIIGGRKFENDDGKILHETDMRKAIIKSSNVYFTAVSKKIGKDNMIEAFDKFLITKQIPFEGLKTVESGITITERKDGKVKTIDLDECDAAAIASASFGQEPIKVSPMHMALAVSAIANDGKIMKPYLMQKTVRGNNVKYAPEPEVLSRACSAKAARYVRSYMVDCIDEGTGAGAKIRGFSYGGKTGTAQTGKGSPSNAWFVGFAPANDPQISFCVMVDKGGYGGSICAPIVKDLVNYCRENGIVTR